MKLKLFIFLFFCIRLFAIAQQFTNSEDLKGRYYTDAAWGDYDNDGDLDYILSGYSSIYGKQTILYENTGTGFTEKTDHGIVGFQHCALDWGDCDNDGDLDLLISGDQDEVSNTRIYINNGSGVFTEAGSGYNGVSSGDAEWGDYNNDGWLDFFITDYANTEVYKNNGNNTFTLQSQFSFSYNGPVGHWGDVNGDGYLDIVLGHEWWVRTFLNDKGVSFIYSTNIDRYPYEIYTLDFILEDYDNDGDLDLIFSDEQEAGSGNVNSYYFFYESDIYYDNDWGSDAVQLYYYDDDYGDYYEYDIGYNVYYCCDEYEVYFYESQHGDWNSFYFSSSYDYGDYAYYPNSGGSSYIAVIKTYSNNGSGSFSNNETIELNEVNTPVKLSSGDATNNGYADIIAAGSYQEMGYHNSFGSYLITNYGFSFSVNSSPDFHSYGNEHATQFGDYDNDNLLDFFLTGYSGYDDGSTSEIYNNTRTNPTNPEPSVPENLNYQFINDTLNLSWDASTDSETASPGLSYNLRIGLTSGGSEVLSPMSLATGKRLIPKHGNAGFKTNYKIDTLPASAAFYIAVQAVDKSFIGSAFSDELVISFGNQAKNVAFSDITQSSATISWDTTGYSSTVVFIKKNASDVPRPADSTIYNANTLYGDGDQIETTGWYCVHNGTDTSVAVTGLETGMEYKVMVCQYSLDGIYPIYEVSPNVDNPNIFTTQFLYSNSDKILETNYSQLDFNWGDMDNDGDLDLIVAGLNPTAKTTIYRNDGSDTFTELTSHGIIDMYNSKVSWADVNNDGYLDILMIGYNGGYKNELYINNQDNTFSKASAIFNTVAGEDINWGDIDHDGDLDLLYSGSNRTYLYENIDGDNFTLKSEFTGSGSNVDYSGFIDFNNDGYTDIIQFTYVESLYQSKLYQNNGYGIYTEHIGHGLPGYMATDFEVVDFNNDNYQDVVIYGTNIFERTELYKNNADGTFSNILNHGIDAYKYSRITFADYDNDGLLDAFLTGNKDDDYPSAFFKNINGEEFEKIESFEFSEDRITDCRFVDYDGDSDQDLFVLTYKSSPGYQFKIYKNDYSGTANNAPALPTGLTVGLTDDGIEVNWNTSTDDLTGSNGISYNLRIGSTAGALDVLSPESDLSNGFRKVQRAGNAGFVNNYTLKELTSTEYYISAQAIDNNGNASAFSNELNLSIPQQATNVSFSNIERWSAAISWNNGNLSNRVVFMKEDSTGYAHPENNTTYTADTVFGQGTQIGTTGWYCVYNGTGTSVNVSGLKSYTNYIVMVCEYDAIDSYLTYTTKTNPDSFTAKSKFYERTDLSFLGYTYGDIDIVDIDIDGDYDLFFSGVTNYTFSSGYCRTYVNNAGTFTENGHSIQNDSRTSADWSDMDNDGDLDLILSERHSFEVYENDNGTLVEISIPVSENLTEAHATWGDFNNDGYADILCSGSTSVIFKNKRNGEFEELNTVDSLPSCTEYYEYLHFVDYNNDGWLDIFAPYNATKIYENDTQGGIIPQPSISFPESDFTVWEDINQDGLTDLILQYSDDHIRFFINNGDETFTENVTAKIESPAGVKFKIIDFDNDGDLDIMAYGIANLDASLYQNNGSFVFTKVDYPIPGYRNSHAEWGDYDKDGDIDFIMNGNVGSTEYTTLFENEHVVANQPPTVPAGLSAEFVGSGIKFTWNDATDDSTHQNNISYNLRIGSASGRIDLLSPAADSITGERYKTGLGNVGYRNEYILRYLENTTVYAAVQSIDKNGLYSNFSAQIDFTIPEQAHTLVTSNITTSQMSLSWTAGDYEKSIVFVKETNVGTAFPENDAAYTANSVFGLGSQIGTTGWYCVYNGSGTSLDISGLDFGTDYSIMVCTYNENSGNEEYLTYVYKNNLVVETTSHLYSSDIAIELAEGYKESCIDWGDYDKDGFLDLAIIGNDGSNNKTAIYKNNSGTSFTKQNLPVLENVANGAIKWGDYSGDGYLDLILTGENDVGDAITAVYRNDQSGGFVQILTPELMQVKNSYADWGDFDNDGDLDLLLCGANGNLPNGRATKIYENKGNDEFQELESANLISASSARVHWADYDNDGYLDIIISSYYQFQTGLNYVYHNNGDGTFTKVDMLNTIYESDVEWEDFDNDGDLDIFLSGQHDISYKTYTYTHIYENDLSGDFKNVSGTNLWTSAYEVDAGDIDNDGDIDIVCLGWDYDLGTRGILVYLNNGDFTFERIRYNHIPFISSSIELADIDNDTYLDVVMSGIDLSNNYRTIIYKNLLDNVTNNAPSVPGNVTATYHKKYIDFNWDASTDDHTPQNSISYNLSFKNGDYFIKSPHSDLNSGKHMVFKRGNMQFQTNYENNYMLGGDCVYQLQAIDNANNASAFSSEQIISIPQQSKNIIQVEKELFAIKIKWTGGDYGKRAVFVGETKNLALEAQDFTTYTADTSFSNGDQIGSTGYYCVYNGTADSVSIGNLEPGKTYYVWIFEYTGSTGAEEYLVYQTVGNPMEFQTLPYFEEIQEGMTDYWGGSVAWGDYNMDGYLDANVNGRLYKNNGDGSFSEETGFPFNSVKSYVDWGDYDNDGDLDLLASGFSGMVLRNNGDGSFTEQTHMSFDADDIFTSRWGDYNNDGYLDIMLVCNYYTGSGYETYLYKNNKNNTFSKVPSVSVPGLRFGDADWADFNKDGYLDLAVTGHNYYFGTDTYTTEAYQNNGDGTFNTSSPVIDAELYQGSIQWGDFNADGYFDLLVSGRRYTTADSVKVFQNNQDGTFSRRNDFNLPGALASDDGYDKTNSFWFDWNSDGYLDILINGWDNSENVSYLYVNDQTGNGFTFFDHKSLEGMHSGYAAPADYDNDGDLDILFAGKMGENSAVKTKLYKNNWNIKNTPPTPPTGIDAYYSNDTLLISWNKGTDNETPQEGLSYNVRVGTTENGCEIVSPMASLASGKRYIVDWGNASQDTFFLVTEVTSSTLYINVQTIDNSFEGSPFSETLGIGTKTKMDIYPDTIDFGNLLTSTTKSVKDSSMLINIDYGEIIIDSVSELRAPYSVIQTYPESISVDDTTYITVLLDLSDSIGIFSDTLLLYAKGSAFDTILVTSNIEEGYFIACADTIEHPWFQAKAQNGSRVFTIDFEGNMYIDAGTIDENTSFPGGTFTNSFIIKNTADTVFLFNKNYAFINGQVFENASYADLNPSTIENDFIIRNNLGEIVARFEEDTGNIYLKGFKCP